MLQVRGWLIAVRYRSILQEPSKEICAIEAAGLEGGNRPQRVR